jgi:hypothetical protein
VTAKEMDQAPDLHEDVDRLCGACGQHHPDFPDACDLDDRTEMEKAQERGLWEALFALNRSMGLYAPGVKSPSLADGVPAVLVVARDDVWELGEAKYGWRG